MDAFKNLVLALHNDEGGATATEYIVLLVLVACFVIAVVAAFGEEISELFEEATDDVEQLDVRDGATGY